MTVLDLSLPNHRVGCWGGAWAQTSKTVMIACPRWALREAASRPWPTTLLEVARARRRALPKSAGCTGFRFRPTVHVLYEVVEAAERAMSAIR